MSFKVSPAQFEMIDIARVEPDPASPRQSIDEAALKSLINSIQKMGVIHPLVVQPANVSGRYTIIVGERRWRAAVLAGEQSVPALIRTCPISEVMNVQVAENMGQGVRAALEPREMANAIQSISERFDNQEAAAEHFGGTHAWLKQVTAAASVNLSPKISALLDSGRISSAGTAIQLERLSQKNSSKADYLIGQIEQMPEGEKLSKKAVDRALFEEGGRRKKREEAPPLAATDIEENIIIEEDHAAQMPDRNWINPGKVKRVAHFLGLPNGNEAEVLTRLIDAFLLMKEEGSEVL